MTENYTCYIDYDNETEMYFGEVRGRYDAAIFRARTLEELRASFADSLNDLVSREVFNDELSSKVQPVARFHAASVDELLQIFHSSITVH